MNWPNKKDDTLSQAKKVWAMDFVSDSLANCRRFRVLNIIDLFTRELLRILVDSFISGTKVAKTLDILKESCNLPEAIITNNGSEFTSKAMSVWAQENHVNMSFIRRGKPMENGFV